MFPSIEPTEVGSTGLAWLLISYGYILYYASNLIAEGSDLLMLVPSMAGLVGGAVLPLLGAVPDGAIMLFSGLGDIETAQETLSVGVGALAGSTIMLLTVPWALSVFGGRVDLDEHGTPNYMGKPKLTPKDSIRAELTHTGISITDEVKHGGVVMMLTSIPYFIIQVPAFFIHGPHEEVAEKERWWALAGLIVCMVGFISYLFLQLQISKKGEDRLKRVAVMKKLMKEGMVSLSGALGATLLMEEAHSTNIDGGDYEAVVSSEGGPSPQVAEYLKEVLRDAFREYDANGDGTLDREEVTMFFRDFHESIEDDTMDQLYGRIDLDGDGIISFDEFITACYFIIKDQTIHDQFGTRPSMSSTSGTPSKRSVHIRGGSDQREIVRSMFDSDDEEQEDVPEDISQLSPDEQQATIKRRAFVMLLIGTTLVVLFSDPMVDVLQETANRIGISPFYVSFILAPLASNASEVIASQYYAAKKTRKTISVSLTALEGAASMNNTFCLSIFMGLIFWRGLAWEFTAETITIVAVEFLIGFLVRKRTMTTGRAVRILALFPLSIALVAILEALGFD